MLNLNTISARDLQKSYRSIINKVKSKKQPVILTTKNQPQAAIVSLEDLDKLQQIKYKQGSLEMLKFIAEHKEELRGLPADLRERADDILYGSKDG